LTAAVLDAGALIALERNDRRATAIVKRARERQESLAVPAAVVAQVWRDGRRQAILAGFLRSTVCEVVPFGDHEARAAGQLLGVRGMTDVVDASVAVLARRRRVRVVTSDAADLRRLDPTLDLVEI
jgi:predicted nucleic acid-binding protein